MTVRMLCRPPSSASLPSSSSSSSGSTVSSCSQFLPTAGQDHTHFSGSHWRPEAATSSDSVFHGSGAASSVGNSVVVVGVVGKTEEDLAQLLDRMLDARVFGGSRARNDIAGPGNKDSTKHMVWIRNKLKHYYDEERGLVYVLFSWGSPPVHITRDDDMSTQALPSLLEHHEMAVLRGLLFMFSVCHVILLVEEGARFEPKLLRMFRVLQAAKSAMAPFVKTHVLPSMLPASSKIAPARASQASGNSPGRAGLGSRHGSTISLMSGSSPTLFPGQCIPVLLFVCLEDFSDNLDSPDTSPQVGPSGRQALIAKSSVMTARSANKLEVGVRKKFQSSVEAQVRFLIKKCRTVLGFGDAGHGGGPGMGPRGPGSGMGSVSGAGGGGALFTMDPSRVVLFVGRSSNRCCEALEATTNILEDMLKGKLNAENALWDAAPVADDIQNIKDFVWRQAEILRGRGGSSTASVGVGMVAAAAAAAAASAAAGSTGATSKPICNPPELPTLTSWLAACNLIMGALMKSESSSLDEGDNNSILKVSEASRTSRRNSPGPGDSNKTVSRSIIETALASLDTGMGMDMKFSAVWCRKVLPSAREVYLKGLPSCYPTAVHNHQLEKALCAFWAMVRGPAVNIFSEKLKEECEAVWKSGRQLCDAVSLTGRACTHQVHQVPNGFLSENATGKDSPKPHSSGVVFLNACACGRSRRLREDPFDYESANVTFFQFPSCEELLQSVILPHGRCGPSGGSAWNLVRLGNAKYYQPSVGLLQSGFCADQNFLSQWDIPVVYKTANPDSEVRDQSGPEKPLDGFNRPSKNSKNDQQIVSGLMILKPVEEVKFSFAKGSSEKQRAPDASMRMNYSEDSAFPPLPQKTVALPKASKQTSKKESVLTGGPRHTKLEQVKEHVENGIGAGAFHSGQALQAVNLHTTANTSNATRDAAQVTVYIGFEHECPHGHRFFLSLEHLQKLGRPYAGFERKLPSKRPKAKVTRLSTSETLAFGKSADRFQTGAVGSLSEFTTAMQNMNVGEGGGDGRMLLSSDLPIYMECPYCKTSGSSGKGSEVNFAGTVSRLQRMFLVTPPFPLLLGSCPLVQFDESLAQNVKSDLRFNFDCEVVLPPDSFLSLRLPFVYCTENVDGSFTPLLCKEDHPEGTAWLLKGTALYVLPSGGENSH